jgi:hypothetical protein
VTLIQQGYPVGPHSLAVAGAELSGGNLVSGFSGVTIAVPVIGAMTALAATRTLGRRRGALAAPLAALPYLVASYLAQGAFKEIFAATFLLAFAIWLWDLSRGTDPLAGGRRGWAVPGAVLVAGMLYSYSGPGLAWIAGTIGVWAAIALLRSPSAALAKLRPALPGLAVALVALVVLVAPEASRILDFGGSAGNVANSRDAEPGALAPNRPLLTRAGDSDAGTGYAPIEEIDEDDPDAAAPQESRTLDLFDNDLGNLFGDIPALEMFGVWPSGDFRVEPGDGAIPAPVFYLAALLGAVALGVGLARAWRDRDDALIAALAAALVIWVAALALSTPYTAAKALQMVAPLLMLIALRGVLRPDFSPLRPRPGLGAVLAAAFVLAAAGSSALALANAPVGPERYTAGIAKLRPELTDVPVLMLAPAEQLAERHGAEFYGWELRGGEPICVEAFPEDETGYGVPAPDGIRYVITIGGKTEPPFTDLVEVGRRNRVALWEVPEFDATRAPDIEIDPAQPANCDLGLPAPDA